MKLNLSLYDIPEKLRMWAEEQEEHQSRHVGTHIDVYHRSSLQKLSNRCRGVIIDVIGREIVDLASIEGISIEEGDFVIFRTGYMERFGYGSNEYFNLEEAPHLTTEFIDTLIARGIALLGIDLHGIQHQKSHVHIDKYCEERGVYVVENITNLDKIASLCELQLKWNQKEGATAIPVEIEVI